MEYDLQLFSAYRLSYPETPGTNLGDRAAVVQAKRLQERGKPGKELTNNADKHSEQPLLNKLSDLLTSLVHVLYVTIFLKVSNSEI